MLPMECKTTYFFAIYNSISAGIFRKTKTFGSGTARNSGAELPGMPFLCNFGRKRPETMAKTLCESERYENLDLAEQYVDSCEYYKCTFVKCNFSKADLSDVDFDECTFENCDLTMAKLKNSGMRDLRFDHCKLLGLDFSVCNQFRFGARFSDCILDYSIFFKLKIPKTLFANCSLKEAEFAEADLSSALFDNCDLENAGFAFTDLRKADLRTSANYRIDPEQTRIRGARFSYPALLGLLTKYDISVE